LFLFTLVMANNVSDKARVNKILAELRTAAAARKARRLGPNTVRVRVEENPLNLCTTVTSTDDGLRELDTDVGEERGRDEIVRPTSVPRAISDDPLPRGRAFPGHEQDLREDRAPSILVQPPERKHWLDASCPQDDEDSFTNESDESFHSVGSHFDDVAVKDSEVSVDECEDGARLDEVQRRFILATGDRISLRTARDWLDAAGRKRLDLWQRLTFLDKLLTLTVDESLAYGLLLPSARAGVRPCGRRLPAVAGDLLSDYLKLKGDLNLEAAVKCLSLFARCMEKARQYEKVHVAGVVNAERGISFLHSLLVLASETEDVAELRSAAIQLLPYLLTKTSVRALRSQHVDLKAITKPLMLSDDSAMQRPALRILFEVNLEKHHAGGPLNTSEEDKELAVALTRAIRGCKLPADALSDAVFTLYFVLDMMGSSTLLYATLDACDVDDLADVVAEITDAGAEVSAIARKVSRMRQEGNTVMHGQKIKVLQPKPRLIDVQKVRRWQHRARLSSEVPEPAGDAFNRLQRCSGREEHPPQGPFGQNRGQFETWRPPPQRIMMSIRDLNGNVDLMNESAAKGGSDPEVDQQTVDVSNGGRVVAVDKAQAMAAAGRQNRNPPLTRGHVLDVLYPSRVELFANEHTVGRDTLAMHVCAFLNEGKPCGGRLLIGVNPATRKVWGVRMTRKQRDCFRQGVDELMRLMSPRLYTDCLQVEFREVCVAADEWRTDVVPDLKVVDVRVLPLIAAKAVYRLAGGPLRGRAFTRQRGTSVEMTPDAARRLAVQRELARGE